MDGWKLKLNALSRFILIVAITLLSSVRISAEETLDESFLMFIAETAEIEELGVDIGKMIDETEQQEQNESSEQESQ